MVPGSQSLQLVEPKFEARRRVPLAERTSVRLGGSAEFFARVDDAGAALSALAWAEARGLPVTVLGGGSNVVVSDAGIAGLVLELGACGESVRSEGEQIEISVGAGVVWDELVARVVARGWAGLECLSGIPGKVGATPIQNVGAYGQEVAQTLVAVEVLDTGTRRCERLPASECGFGYRTSRFKAAENGRFIVLSVSFRLLAGGPACLAYPEIARRFSGANGAPTLAEVRKAVLATRAAKSMLPDPADENGRSCGSFFVNPQLSAPELDALRARAPLAPAFAQADGRFKVPAAWLIEQAGFQRGQRFGAVGISSRHCLALVCHAGATAAELVAAAHRVRDGVAERLGVWLEPEPRFLGFSSSDGALPGVRRSSPLTPRP